MCRGYRSPLARGTVKERAGIDSFPGIFSEFPLFFRATFSCFSLLFCDEEFGTLANVLVSRVCALFGSCRSFGVSRFESLGPLNPLMG